MVQIRQLTTESRPRRQTGRRSSRRRSYRLLPRYPFRSKVDGSVPRTQDVNLRVVREEVLGVKWEQVKCASTENGHSQVRNPDLTGVSLSLSLSLSLSIYIYIYISYTLSHSLSLNPHPEALNPAPGGPSKDVLSLFLSPYLTLSHSLSLSLCR